MDYLNSSSISLSTKRALVPYDCLPLSFGEYRYNEKGENLKDIVLNTIKNSPYYNKFNDKFFNWPGDEDLGGFTLEFGVLNDEHKISELDRHPNAKGQQKIAEYLYDRLG